MKTISITLDEMLSIKEITDFLIMQEENAQSNESSGTPKGETINNTTKSIATGINQKLIAAAAKSTQGTQKGFDVEFNTIELEFLKTKFQPARTQTVSDFLNKVNKHLDSSTSENNEDMQRL